MAFNIHIPSHSHLFNSNFLPFPFPMNRKRKCRGLPNAPYAQTHGLRNRGVWGGGTMSPSLLGPAGYRGVLGSGPMKMIFASTADNFYSVYTVQVTYISAFYHKTERWNAHPTCALSKGILVKEFVMVATCNLRQYKPFPDDPEIFHQVLSVMLILVLVLKDSLRTKFKSLSLSLPLRV